MPLSKAKRNPFGPDQTVRATRSFANELGTVRKGDYFKGGDAIVESAWTAFVDGETLDRDLENEWETLPPAPAHQSPIITGVTIESWRQVVSQVDVFLPMSWSPDSVGSKRGVPPPFGGSLTRGQVKDFADPIVQAHPEWFRTVARDLTREDLDRLGRLEQSEHLDNAA